MLPNKEFLIVGESGINISDYIKLEPNVKVLGVQNKLQIKSLYQKSKFYFQGSRLEGLPNSLCEAMLCGCVPIGSKVFGIPDAIGSTGILFDIEKDLAQVADFINSNIGTKEFKNARKRIKKKFNLASRIEKIKKIFDLEIGVLGYIGSRNIGDYIQTKAVIDMIHPINHKVLDREGLINLRVLS